VHVVYIIIGTLLYPVAFLGFFLYTRISGRYKSRLSERFGRPDRALRGRLSRSPRIWIHAVSVGEVNLAETFIERLRLRCPACTVIISATTPQGLARAEARLAGKAVIVAAPLDFAPAVTGALGVLLPDVMVFLETEIWPNWILAARRRGIAVVVANGRISSRAFSRYRKVKSVIRPLMSGMDAVSTIGAGDAARFRHLGGRPGRVVVCGNAKFDVNTDFANPDILPRWRRILGIEDRRPVILAGSTRSGEETLLAPVFQRVKAAYPAACFLVAPRHVRRSEAVRRLFVLKGFRCRLRSEPPDDWNCDLIAVDTMGELKSLYGLATVVFCGGSFVPRGGQNVLEPAAWGKPVFFGPYMEDFRAAADALEAAGGGRRVNSGEALAEAILSCLDDPERCRAMGRAAAAVLTRNRGAVDRHVRAILSARNRS
jgi:3-deoxy-D-manno-octulosonic-acid transferase